MEKHRPPRADGLQGLRRDLVDCGGGMRTLGIGLLANSQVVSEFDREGEDGDVIG